MHGNWRLRAACRDADTDMFIPVGESLGQYNKGKQYCQVCPVTQECLQLALDTNSEYGLFGGMTPAERRRLKAGLWETAEFAVGHGDKAGTTAGYYREKAAGLRPCVDCTEAYNAYVRAAQLRRKERKQHAKATAGAVPA